MPRSVRRTSLLYAESVDGWTKPERSGSVAAVSGIRFGLVWRRACWPGLNSTAGKYSNRPGSRRTAAHTLRR